MAKRNRFTNYFAPLLDALRSKDPEPMRPPEATAFVRSSIDVPETDLARFIINGKQTIFENDVHWARFYLARAGLISAPKRGLWGLTNEGRETRLTPEDTWALYVRIRDAHRVSGSSKDEEDTPAPEITNDDYGPAYWFVGAVWDGTDDQTPRFLKEEIWQNGDDKLANLVKKIQPGDRIAIKASFVQKNNLPFDVGGKPVSGMRIKATGTILNNLDDGKTVTVGWDPPFEPKDWYLFTYRIRIVRANTESEDGRRLVDFTFGGGTQDYKWFLAQPYWREKYGSKGSSSVSIPAGSQATLDDLFENEEQEEPDYTVKDIIQEGCFLSSLRVESILEQWRTKKNLVLQGPPGTGKTWLAKRLGFALVGSNDRETTRSRLRIVQFHPSLSYEDFVRGWRPAGDGRLSLSDGIFIQAIEAAKSEPDRPFVLVIEEINRGNPAQIFGEMLTLLENTKRRASEAIELAYRNAPGERVYVPDNLYVIGTMNVADRSLAIVDLALRRRFAFVDLDPTFGEVWRKWCIARGIDESKSAQIENRICDLNSQIASSVSLGPQFRIGHSFVTPDEDDLISDAQAWFWARVETEIGPLLDEYWYDSPEKSKAARSKLLDPLR